jgi:hypothetical protein
MWMKVLLITILMINRTTFLKKNYRFDFWLFVIKTIYLKNLCLFSLNNTLIFHKTSYFFIILSKCNFIWKFERMLKWSLISFFFALNSRMFDVSSMSLHKITKHVSFTSRILFDLFLKNLLFAFINFKILCLIFKICSWKVLRFFTNNWNDDIKLLLFVNFAKHEIMIFTKINASRRFFKENSRSNSSW